MKKLYVSGQVYRQLQIYREVIVRCHFDTLILNESDSIYVNKLINAIQNKSLTQMNLKQRLITLSEIIFYVRTNDICSLRQLVEKGIRKSEIIHQSDNGKNKLIVY